MEKSIATPIEILLSLINKYRLYKFLSAHAATVLVNNKTDFFYLHCFQHFK